MMATLPQFKQRQLARTVSRRGSSDIERLAKQYKTSIEALTADYERASAENTRKMQEQMAPFEASMAQYKSALDDYTANVLTPYQQASDKFSKDATAYAQQESAYAAELAQIASGARDRTSRSYEAKVGRQGSYDIYDFFIDDPFTGKRLPLHGPEGVVNNPKKYGFDAVLLPPEIGQRGKPIYGFRPLPSTPEPGAAPVAPQKPAAFAMEMPKAPTITQVDEAPFAAKKEQALSDFNREVGERRAAKMTAATRRSARPLLQGA